MKNVDLKTSLSLSREVVVVGRTSSSQDGIVVVGYVYQSRQNGIVLDAGGGVSPTLSVGQHFGCEPKIRVVYEV